MQHRHRFLCVLLGVANILTACVSVDPTPTPTPIPTPTLEPVSPLGCEGIQDIVSLYYVLEDRVETYMVVDCLGLTENWEKTIQRNEIVEIGSRWGIAQKGVFEEWLQVLIWQGSEDPYVLNLAPLEE